MSSGLAQSPSSQSDGPKRKPVRTIRVFETQYGISSGSAARNRLPPLRLRNGDDAARFAQILCCSAPWSRCERGAAQRAVRGGIEVVEGLILEIGVVTAVQRVEGGARLHPLAVHRAVNVREL